jgi:lantibiotic modifying enzyme
MNEPDATPAAFLAIAAGIGRALCREAHWDREGRWCNWMGRSSREMTRAGGPITPTAVALGPDVYGGSAGVALFLAQLGAVTGDEECHRTALGAIARSLRQMTHRPAVDAVPLSFFAGVVGLAHVAHRVAVLMAAPALDDEVDVLLAAIERAATNSHLLDVLGGSAGAIPALLSLARVDRWRRLRELAVDLGKELCRTAVRQGSVWTWDVEKTCGPGVATVMLAGFGHGASGLGLALLELYAATGRDEFLEGGRAAFVYEDQLFDPRVGNWPDLRSLDSAPGPRYMVAWCHGAPGIALARLRARALDAERQEAYEATARTALDTTVAALERMGQHPRADASLCHGVAGMAEVLLTGGDWLGDENYCTRARAAAASLARHAAPGDWPSGVSSQGPNPSLMLGTAGIGYHFLRQALLGQVPPILVTVP